MKRWHGVGLALICSILQAGTAYAEPVSFTALKSPLDGVATDIIPTVGDFISNTAGLILVPLVLVAIAIFIGLIVKFYR